MAVALLLTGLYNYSALGPKGNICDLMMRLGGHYSLVYHQVRLHSPDFITVIMLTSKPNRGASVV